MPLTAKMPKMPDDLRAAAEEADAEIEGALVSLIPAPERPYNPKTVTSLANAIAAVGKVMGIELKPDPYTAPVPELEPEVVRFLAMVDAAAKDYGQPLPVSLDAIRNDNDLMLITSHLMALAKDRDFKDFLNAPIEEEVTVEEGMDEEDGEETETEEFDFAARMR